jgi:hypothetical protein
VLHKPGLRHSDICGPFQGFQPAPMHEIGYIRGVT